MMNRAETTELRLETRQAVVARISTTSNAAQPWMNRA